MSNFDRAVEALNDVDVIYGALVGNENYATVLQGRGLLAPDLPEPDNYNNETPYWYSDSYGIRVGRLTKRSPMRVMLWDVEPGGVLNTDIESARDYALKILAACEYAEKEQDNE